jgi:hypothetical protein
MVMVINFFVFLSILFLFCGLALDAGMLQLRRLQLQHAADAAALGAVYERLRGYSDWVSAGKTDAALNGYTDGSSGVSINIVSPPTSGSYSGVSTAVEATITQSYHTAFMGLITGGSNATPGVKSVAAGSPTCVYIMGSGTSTFYPLANANYSGIYSNCSLYFNSSSQSINNQSGSTISVSNGSSIRVQGPSGDALLYGNTSPAPGFGSFGPTDPLAGETAPTFSSCTYTGKTLNGSTTSLSPGTYCGGITICGGTVTFTPGLYIVTGGMTWECGANISGTGVTFYLTAGGGYSYGNFNILTSTVSLSAPTSTSSGGLTGIVVFVDRNWANNGSQGIQISSSYVSTNGIWYALNTGLYNYASTLTGSAYLGVVLDNMSNSYATFSFPSPNYSSLSGGPPFVNSYVGNIVE